VTNLKLGIAALLPHGKVAARGAAVDRAPPGIAPRPPPIDAGARNDGTMPTDALVMHRIAALRPAHSIVVEEAPSSRGAMHDYLPFTERDTFYTCASGGLGHALPAAVGVALARPDRKVIALLGDGSAMYAIQGLWSAKSLGTAVAFIIINNQSYRALDAFAHHFGIASLPATVLGGLDFCALAAGQGVAACRVTACAELEAALKTAFSATAPMLVEVCVR
jgi:benzoylformate decarboxylase